MAIDNSLIKPLAIGLGMNGLVGTKVASLLSETNEILKFSRHDGVDITRPESLRIIKNNTTHPYVFHFAAKADVDKCEQDKTLDMTILGYEDTKKKEAVWQEKKTAWAVNVYGTQNVVDACLQSGKTLIYISTDFVFNGEDTPPGGYIEESKPDPINWYARTKYEGEKIVISSGIPYIILRIAYPYRNAFREKKDFVHAILNRLQSGQRVQAVADHVMTPTFVDDLAHALKLLLHHNHHGIFHVVGDTALSPYDATLAIAQVFDVKNHAIEKITRADFFYEKAPRPFNLTMKNDKIKELGIRMKTFEEGLFVIRKQEENTV